MVCTEMDMIKLTTKQWHVLRDRLRQDYPSSVMLIRSRMREVLGFTDRAHVHWFTPPGSSVSRAHHQIHLDFFNHVLETFFRIKYAEYIDPVDRKH